jgi:hypothetical protein
MKTRLLLCVFAFVLFLYSVPLHAITWTTLDYPGASQTSISDIDGSSIVGTYRDASGKYGFLYNVTTWTTLDLPSGGSIYGISGSNIVGTIPSTQFPYGLLYNGTSWCTLNFLGPNGYIGTNLYDIDGDNIVGDTDAHGVIYNLDSQTWATLDYPGATKTLLYGIDQDNIVGLYRDTSGSWHDFFYDGTWTTLDLPDYITGVSGRNIVTNSGIYNLDSEIWTALAFPAASQTSINGIDGDNIVGTYWDVSGKSHGFIATIPEPATVSLLGLGILALRRKRAV